MFNVNLYFPSFATVILAVELSPPKDPPTVKYSTPSLVGSCK